MDKIQNEAARIVTGCTKLVSIRNLYEETKWESLEERRKKHKLTLFYKMVNNFTPSYLSSLVPQPVNAASAYNLRNQNNIQSIATRTNYYFNSFLPSTIREWNSIPLDTRNSGSIETFKRKLNRDVTGDTIFPMMEVTPKTIRQNGDSSIYLYRTHFLCPTRFTATSFYNVTILNFLSNRRYLR